MQASFKEIVENKLLRYEAHIRKSVQTKQQTSLALSLAKRFLQPLERAGGEGAGGNAGGQSKTSRNDSGEQLECTRSLVLQKLAKSGGASQLSPRMQFTAFTNDSQLIIGAEERMETKLQEMYNSEQLKRLSKMSEFQKMLNENTIYGSLKPLRRSDQQLIKLLAANGMQEEGSFLQRTRSEEQPRGAAQSSPQSQQAKPKRAKPALTARVPELVSPKSSYFQFLNEKKSFIKRKSQFQKRIDENLQKHYFNQETSFESNRLEQPGNCLSDRLRQHEPQLLKTIDGLYNRLNLAESLKHKVAIDKRLLSRKSKIDSVKKKFLDEFFSLSRPNLSQELSSQMRDTQDLPSVLQIDTERPNPLRNAFTIQRSHPGSFQIFASSSTSAARPKELPIEFFYRKQNLHRNSNKTQTNFSLTTRNEKSERLNVCFMGEPPRAEPPAQESLTTRQSQQNQSSARRTVYHATSKSQI